MVVEQLPARVGEFANYLNDLMARLDQGGGWCGVFWQRDPDGMRACLDGREVPPWDVVEALLQDPDRLQIIAIFFQGSDLRQVLRNPLVLLPRVRRRCCRRSLELAQLRPQVLILLR